MTAVTRELRGVWGIDTSWKLSPANISALCQARIPASVAPSSPPIDFFVRYLSLGPQSPADLSVTETSAILAMGRALFAAQHVRASHGQGWDASGALGASDGQWAARNAVTAGLVDGLGICVALDLEDVSQATWGQPTIDHATEWCRQVVVAGFEPVVYVGFNCGLSPAQLYGLPTVRRYWSDYGPRSVIERGFACTQHAQTSIAGVAVDPDYAGPDNMGDCLVGMADDGRAQVIR